MSATVVLPRRLDLPAARPLARSLMEMAGQNLRIDAEGVGFLGGLCLQVLLAAGIEWRQSGKSLSIEPRSPEFDLALRQFGLSAVDLATEPQPWV